MAERMVMPASAHSCLGCVDDPAMSCCLSVVASRSWLSASLSNCAFARTTFSDPAWLRGEVIGSGDGALGCAGKGAPRGRVGGRHQAFLLVTSWQLRPRKGRALAARPALLSLLAQWPVLASAIVLEALWNSSHRLASRGLHTERLGHILIGGIAGDANPPPARKGNVALARLPGCLWCAGASRALLAMPPL